MNLYPVLDDKTSRDFRIRYWQGAALFAYRDIRKGREQDAEALPTFLAVEKVRSTLVETGEVELPNTRVHQL